MIHVQAEPLEAKEQDRIRQWLAQPECGHLVRCIVGLQDKAIADAAISNFTAGEFGARGADSVTATQDAHRYKAFLKTLDDVMKPNFQFTKIKMESV